MAKRKRVSTRVERDSEAKAQLVSDDDDEPCADYDEDEDGQPIAATRSTAHSSDAVVASASRLHWAGREARREVANYNRQNTLTVYSKALREALEALARVYPDGDSEHGDSDFVVDLGNGAAVRGVLTAELELVEAARDEYSERIRDAIPGAAPLPTSPDSVAATTGAILMEHGIGARRAARDASLLLPPNERYTDKRVVRRANSAEVGDSKILQAVKRANRRRKP